MENYATLTSIEYQNFRLYKNIEKLPWSIWTKMPNKENCRDISGPMGPGVYQVRNIISNNKILFGRSKACQQRLRSLFPKPFGTGTRNNEDKREYVLEHCHNLEYRCLATATVMEAKVIE